jgi:hypothetical protein
MPFNDFHALLKIAMPDKQASRSSQFHEFILGVFRDEFEWLVRTQMPGSSCADQTIEFFIESHSQPTG